MMQGLFLLLFVGIGVLLVVHEDWLHRDSPKFTLGCLLAAVAVVSAALLVFVWDF